VRGVLFADSLFIDSILLDSRMEPTIDGRLAVLATQIA